jgi:hypothetical protein
MAENEKPQNENENENEDVETHGVEIDDAAANTEAYLDLNFGCGKS